MVKLLTYSNKINIPLNNETGKPKGFAFVQLANINQCMKAIHKINETVFKGRKIEVKLSVDQRFYTKPESEGKATEEIKSKEEAVEEQESEIIEKEADQKIEKKVRPFAKGSEAELKRTIFVQNLPFELGENDILKHFRKLGAIYSIKIIKCPDDPSQGNGKAFIIFKEEETAKKLIDIAQKIERGNISRAIVDPSSLLTFEGRELVVRKALTREDADLANKKKKLDSKIIKKMNSGQLTISEFIETDVNGKRKLDLLRLGLSVTDENVEVRELRETQRRSRHLEEKKIKLANPNLLLSETRVHLKSISKLLDVSQLKTLIRESIKEHFSKKEFNKKKILKSLKLLREIDGDRKSKGIAFADFTDKKLAKLFLESIKRPEIYRTMMNDYKELPIIEAAFIDSRVILKVEQSKKTKKKEKKESVVANLLQNVNQDLKKKEKEKNAEQDELLKQEIRTSVFKSIEIEDLKLAESIAAKLRTFKYRGLRQRLQKKLIEKFGEKVLGRKEKLEPKVKKIAKKARKPRESSIDKNQDHLFESIKADVNKALSKSNL